ncbi:protein spindle-F [Eupeodes corollae]|uniref:protein spindle-F n=1 Tax=Eupeodes corollae TaxID=290404 RepID=UPI00248F7C8E|nr:protein spindle-F [Eupeodes corollae]
MDGNNQADYNMVSQLALRVALQTMKERCLSLQQRLSVVEEENDALRSRQDSDQHQSPNCSLQQNKFTSHNSLELDNLRSQVSELNRQKVQLSDHINMVANENRKLWSRLSQIAKEQQGNDSSQTMNENNADAHSTGDELDSPKANQNLIRSRTFTTHSPNPNLRLNLVNNDEKAEKENDEEASLEEVLLVEASVSDEDEGSNRELKSDEMIGVCETELGFTYLNVHTAPDDDFNIEAKKCLEGLHKIRLEVMQQQANMTSTLETLENRFVLQSCEVCAKKPEMIDKSLDTADIIPEMPEYIHMQDEVEDAVDDEEESNDDDGDDDEEENAQALPSSHVDFIQRKLEADKEVKICPMCGLSFGPTIKFDQFCSHVESHFLQDSSSDSEQNYEFIAHTVGDF